MFCVPQELCEGTLYHFLDLIRPLVLNPVTRAPRLEYIASMLHDVCQGMLYLHSRNIVHGGGWLSGCGQDGVESSAAVLNTNPGSI